MTPDSVITGTYSRNTASTTSIRTAGYGSLRREMKIPDEILKQLDRYDLQGFSHTDAGLVSHLLGTFEILKSWGCSEAICVAGLCHSIYGTESYRKIPIELSERANIKEIIGDDSELLAYLFGAHVKDSLWENLKRTHNFEIKDRLENANVKITESQLQNLITLTLANWLEQRPRAPKEYQFVRQEEFLAAKGMLPKQGYDEFIKAYGL